MLHFESKLAPWTEAWQQQRCFCYFRCKQFFSLRPKVVFLLIPPCVLISSASPDDINYNEVFLCGYRPGKSCTKDGDTRCQFFQVGNCTQFESNAFEEFGLTEIFAVVRLVDQDVYGFQVFKNNDCTGNPFGFVVKQDRMTIDACSPLNLPFVGNQADFKFVYGCEDICDRNANLANDPIAQLPVGGPTVRDVSRLSSGVVVLFHVLFVLIAMTVDVRHIPSPRWNGLIISSTVPDPCSLYELERIQSMPPALSQRFMTMDEPSYIWGRNGMEFIGLDKQIMLITDIWCNSE